jgi:hypothetical protein
MSAHAQKAAAKTRIEALIDMHAQALVEGWSDDLGEMRMNQGTIQGLRLALVAQEEAYKDIGGM